MWLRTLEVSYLNFPRRDENGFQGKSIESGATRETMLCIPEICIERAYLMTESYRETEDEPRFCEEQSAPQNINRDDHLYRTRGTARRQSHGKRRAGTLTPEVNYEWYLKEMETLSTREWDRFQPLTEQERTR